MSSNQPVKVAHQDDGHEPEQPFLNIMKRSNTLNRSELQNGEKLTKEEKCERGRKNWAKLRKYIRDMRIIDNYLVTVLDKEDEMQQENMNGDAEKKGG